jgi:hypothetical protein
MSLKIPRWQSESLLYAFNFEVQNYNVIVIENVFLLSVLKIRFQDRIYKWKKNGWNVNVLICFRTVLHTVILNSIKEFLILVI